MGRFSTRTLVAHRLFAGDILGNEEVAKKFLKEIAKGTSEKGRIRVLVVDDEEIFRETFAEILIEEGYEVFTAGSGEEAIELAKEKKPQVVFMDIKLPGVNGCEVWKMVKKMYPQVKGIMVTAYSVPDLVKEALKEGAITCLYKPFELPEVIKLLKKITEEENS